MFCKNCGKEIPEGTSFCTNCGSRVTPEAEVQNVTPENNDGYTQPQEQPPVQPQEQPPVQPQEQPPVQPQEQPPVQPQEQFQAPIQEPSQFYDDVPNMIPPKKKGKKIAIISIIIAIVLAAGGVVTWLLLRGGEGGSGSKNGYKAEIEAYLDFLADKKDDAEDFIADAHMTGDSFPAGYSGSEADEILFILMDAMFEQQKEFADMYYSDVEDYDDWQEFIEEGLIGNLYDEIESEYGDDWELTYKIGDSEKIDKDDLSDWEDSWEETIKQYENEILKMVEDNLSKKDKEKVEEFIESLDDMDITDGYTVQVEVEVTGDENDHKDDYEFAVLKVGKQWVIFEGPSWSEILEAE